jgi:catechol 2,3-dioxygenase-like lactoylglutathione lyase family enzyme
MKIEDGTKRNAMSPAMEEHQPMPDIILGIQHVGLTVSNIDEALTWFREVLGFKELFREDPIDIDNEYWAEALGVPIGSKLEASVLIGCGAGIELELFQYSSPLVRRKRPMNCEDGGHHLALQVTDIDAAVRRLVDAGATPMGPIKDNPHGPWQGADWIYLKTPFGLTLELLQFPKDGLNFEHRTGRRLNRPRRHAID